MQADKLNSGRKRQSVCVLRERERERESDKTKISEDLPSSRRVGVGIIGRLKKEERSKVNCKMCIFTQLKKTRVRDRERERARKRGRERECVCVSERERERERYACD